jgi:hypothetical protein
MGRVGRQRVAVLVESAHNARMQSKATTVAAYLASLPEDRRQAIEAVRAVVLKHLDKGFEEGMQYGMIGYFVPHAIFPPGYHCDPKQPLPYAGLASQKQHMSLYLMGIYGEPTVRAWFEEAWARTGKKLDMGAACIRFKRVEDLPLDVIGAAFRKLTLRGYIAHYQSMLDTRGSRAGAATKKAASASTKGGKSVAAKSPSRKTSAQPKDQSKAQSKARPKAQSSRASGKTASKKVASKTTRSRGGIAR